ncbi:AraC family transcriptional regulator [Maricurvus nonylphenolicus]|uniref:AraC family transcriptional regulator n=1 Tax=Maricurvus nonylphenolicus TaxID=1008307 RepID=UPI0036F33F9C
MQSYYLSVLVELMAEFGVSEQQLFEGTGFEGVAQTPFQQLKADEVARLQKIVCSNALKLSGNPQLGVLLGTGFDVASQGIIGYALMSSSTVGDALKFLVTYNHEIMPSVDIELNSVPDGVEVIVHGRQLSKELERFFCETLYTVMIFNGSILTSGEQGEFRLDLDYMPAGSLSRYKDVFGSAVSFNAQRRVLFFNNDALNVPVSTANPHVKAIFERECERLFLHDHHQGSLRERVQQLLLQSGSEFPCAAKLAKQLHMSESTLHRRLSKEGFRYQQVMDHIRYRLATEYLCSTSLPVSEVAYLLGFSDVANFRRSFKRWANKTPTEVRQQNIDN